ncbi:hypothetical protein MOC66_20670, partial [Bacillus spizizenii]|nr:hypothetical protein [Bacillus spizizenii]
AIYTTTVAGLLGLSSRLMAFVHMPRWMIVLILLVLMVPFTSFG